MGDVYTYVHMGGYLYTHMYMHVPEGNGQRKK
jgi:hypothetical protein